MSEKKRFDVEAVRDNAKTEHVANAAEVSTAERDQAEQKKQEALAHARHEATVESSDKVKVQERIKSIETQTDENLSDSLVSADLKKSTFHKEIKHIRRKLTPNERVMSRLIHQPFIRTVSEVSSKTISRPSGLLGGGVVAFLGTSGYLYLTKDIGIKYNYTVFLVLLVLGFIVGLVLEALIRLTRQRRSV